VNGVGDFLGEFEVRASSEKDNAEAQRSQSLAETATAGTRGEARVERRGKNYDGNGPRRKYGTRGTQSKRGARENTAFLIT
jgi:hypothetical protein